MTEHHTKDQRDTRAVRHAKQAGFCERIFKQRLHDGTGDSQTRADQNHRYRTR